MFFLFSHVCACALCGVCHVGSMYVSIVYCSMGCVRVVCALCVGYIHACDVYVMCAMERIYCMCVVCSMWYMCGMCHVWYGTCVVCGACGM